MPKKSHDQDQAPAGALEAGIQAAAAAGDVLRRKFPQRRTVRSKGWRDIVTDADLAAQGAIAQVLGARFPDHALFSEEDRRETGLADSVPTWIIDPLDGTTNYAQQFPSFSVSLALVRGQQLLAGVVHEPLRRVTFFAERGGGAFVQQGRSRPRPARVSRLTDLGEGLVGLDWARDPDQRERTVAALARVASACRTLRTLGSAALGLAYVAAGYLDGYYHMMLQPWDLAAGVLLVSEAGGIVTTPEGTAWRLGESQVVASNGVLHASLRQALGFSSALA